MTFMITQKTQWITIYSNTPMSTQLFKEATHRNMSDNRNEKAFDLKAFSEQLKKQQQRGPTKKQAKRSNKKGKSPQENQVRHNTVEDFIRVQDGESTPIQIDAYGKNASVLLNESNEESAQGIRPSLFVILKMIGKGATARVFLVRCTMNNRVYAMKVMEKTKFKSASDRDYVIHERRVLSRLKNRFLITLFCSFQTASHLYLVMDFCQGGELFGHILDKGFFTEDEARFYIAEVILAVEHLHANGIIHRDIKPENILLSASGHVVLCDFGICFDRQQQAPYPHQNSPAILDDDDICDNRVCGTYHYMAPEVLCTSVPYGRAVDWWSVGCLLYEMTSGNPPFMAREKAKLLDMIMKSKPKMPPFLSPELHSLLKGLLERNAMKRLGAEPSTFTQVGGVAKLKKHPFFKGIDWYKLERGEIEPPLKLHFDSDTDTHYFLSKYTEFPLEKLNGLKMEGETAPIDGYTYIGTVFSEFDELEGGAERGKEA
ncbi:protein kinase [Blastocystis sp. ATCC 50177/Nand II]|uniref:Protein kinase n=1 Tax=Blastocystis sp. subtype 1 (strain ATCC 50177 / NandII) TaxID=478820 RepID=A0A196S5S3_BLAHN|nr:protein kinase [Blastocystis sp. ATCC 50177/Nand II]